MVGALGYVVPRSHQRLEFRVGRVHLPGHGGLLGFFPDDLGRKLLEIAQHGDRKLDDLDLALEIRLESVERHRVFRVVIGEAVDLDRHGRMVQNPPQFRREPLERLLVEDELGHRARFMPARIVVVTRGPVQAQLHVVVGPDPFGGVDDTPFERRVDVAAGGDRRRAARFDIDQPAEARADAHPEPLVVADRVHLLSEPSGHLRGDAGAWTGHEVEGGVRLFPQLEPVALLEPGRHALHVHAERDGREPFRGRLLLDRSARRGPVVRSAHERLDVSPRGGGKAVERLHDLTAREDLDPEPPAAGLVDDLCQPLGHTLVPIERRRKSRGHAPLDLRLRDDVGGVDDRRSSGSHHRPARRRDEPASFSRHTAPLTGTAKDDAIW